MTILAREGKVKMAGRREIKMKALAMKWKLNGTGKKNSRQKCSHITVQISDNEPLAYKNSSIII